MADGQPCEECAQMERRLLAGAVVVGVVMGAAFAWLVLKK